MSDDAGYPVADLHAQAEPNEMRYGSASNYYRTLPPPTPSPPKEETTPGSLQDELGQISDILDLSILRITAPGSRAGLVEELESLQRWLEKYSPEDRKPVNDFVAEANTYGEKIGRLCRDMDERIQRTLSSLDAEAFQIDSDFTDLSKQAAANGSTISIFR